MKHLDTFSGYGGFTLGVNEETIGFSEVEPHAIAVLKYHYPNIKNYGDITKITDLPDFDLLTGGSPCQDLSVAGKQKGLAGERSGLFFHFIRLLKEKQPRNFIWENVKGTLSSQDGWDFARVQIEMAEAGYAFGWQVLNAKYFGVPQSRERVFVIGHLGGECAGEVFFEQEDRGKNITELTQNASQGYRVYDSNGIAVTQASQAGGVGAKTGLYMVDDPSRNKGLVDKNIAPTLRSETHGNLPAVLTFIDLSTNSSKLTDNARAIQARYNKGYSHHAGEVSGVMQNFRIRRLTPTECERLMGLPDGWTKYGIKPDGTQYELSDSARYKLCGNGVVVNVVKNIYESLQNS